MHASDDSLHEFKAELEWNIKTLENHMELLSGRDKSFAESLCNWYGQHGYLSDKQMYHVHKFWQTVMSEGATDARPSSGVKVAGKDYRPTPIVPVRDVPAIVADGKDIIKRFDLAISQGGLRYPSLTYLLSEDDKNYAISGRKIRFTRTGAQSKKPGTVLITDGVPYPQGRIFAQILRDGTTVWHERIWEHGEFMLLLKRIIENSVEEMRLNGIKFCHCCFCGLELTNASSRHYGYGPICASKWNLPCGDYPESFYEKTGGKL